MAMSTFLLVLSLCVFAARTVSGDCLESCSGYGKFPSACKDNTYYIECTGNGAQPIVRHCPTLNVFIASSRQCECRDTCVGKEKNGNHASKCKSTSFYVECRDGNAKLKECEADQFFYPSINGCDERCKEDVFKFTSLSEVFDRSCEPIPYKTKPDYQFRTYPGNCKLYYWIVGLRIHLCHTPPGQSFDIGTHYFKDQFYANCTCEYGLPITEAITTTTTTTTTTSTTKTGKSTGGSSNTGVIAGSLVAVLLIVIGGLGLAVFLRRRNNARTPHVEEAKPGIYRISSIQSDTYDELREVDPPYDNNVSVVISRTNVSTLNRGPLPDAPDGTYEEPSYKADDIPEGVYQDPASNANDTYLQPGQLTENNSTGDVNSTTADEGEQNKMDVNDNDNSVMPPPETAPSTPGSADVTDDASQDNENKGG